MGDDGPQPPAVDYSQGPKHRELARCEQDVFWRMFEKAQRKAWLFREINKSTGTQYAWAAWILILAISLLVYGWTTWPANVFCKLMWSVQTVVAFQLYFVFHHMRAYALFLNDVRVSPLTSGKNIDSDESLPDPWGFGPDNAQQWAPCTLVYFVAFMHHHTFERPADVRTITSAHWYSFSLFNLDHPLCVLGGIFGLAAVNPAAAIVAATWEICALLLPIAHGYQHHAREEIGVLYPAVDLLVRLRVLAGKREHLRHHNHGHETVYQGFESSGLNIMPFGFVFDDWWNKLYRAAVRKGTPLSDEIDQALAGPVAIFGLWFVFVLLWGTDLSQLFVAIPVIASALPIVGPAIDIISAGITLVLVVLVGWLCLQAITFAVVVLCWMLSRAL